MPRPPPPELGGRGYPLTAEEYLRHQSGPKPAWRGTRENRATPWVLTSLLGSGHVKLLCFLLWQISEMEAIHLIRFSPQHGENWFWHSKGELSRTGSDEEVARFRIEQEKWGFGSCFTFSDNSTGKAVGTWVPCVTLVTIQSLMEEVWLLPFMDPQRHRKYQHSTAIINNYRMYWSCWNYLFTSRPSSLGVSIPGHG